MPAKIRLTRQGRKKRPFYHIVIADSRAPRDGRFIERIGLYDPNTNPATIELNFDSALNWLQNGAQPTDTCRAILSYKGVLFKNHLLNGVKKGAFSEEEAEKRFQGWLKDKEGKIQSKKDTLLSDKNEKKRVILAAEAKVNEARAEDLAKRQSALAEEAALAEKKANEPEESVSVEAAAEQTENVAVEEQVVEQKEVAEVVEEAVEKEPVRAEATEEAEVKAEESKEEATEETEVKEEVPEVKAEESKEEATEETEVKEEVPEVKAEEGKEEAKAEEKK